MFRLWTCVKSCETCRSVSSPKDYRRQVSGCKKGENKSSQLKVFICWAGETGWRWEVVSVCASSQLHQTFGLGLVLVTAQMTALQLKKKHRICLKLIPDDKLLNPDIYSCGCNSETQRRRNIRGYNEPES